MEECTELLDTQMLETTDAIIVSIDNGYIRIKGINNRIIDMLGLVIEDFNPNFKLNEVVVLELKIRKK